MYTYDQPILSTYSESGVTLSSAGEKMNVSGPEGYFGRLVDVSVNVTTGVTVAASLLEVGSAADADAYGTLSVPVTSADGVVNGATVLTSDDNLIPNDGPVVVTCDGGATAGAGTITLVIAWFKAVAIAT